MGLALEGKAPRIFAKCTKNGVPIYAVLLVLLISLLSFLQVSNSTAVVLDWFISLVTASQLINFSAMCVTYLRFHKALQVQGMTRDSLPYRSPLPQPFAAWYGLVGCFIMTFVGGYTVFLPGNWNVPDFLFSYTMIGVCPVLYVGWKVLKRSTIQRAGDMDLGKDLEEIEEYEANYVAKPPRYATLKSFCLYHILICEIIGTCLRRGWIFCLDRDDEDLR